MMNDATDAQIAQATLAHIDTRELIQRLQAEGIDWRIVLTGIGAAMAEMIEQRCGPNEPSVYFARMSAMTMPRGDQA